MPVDAVDAAAQQVRPEPEGERALEPDRLGLGAAVLGPVALERLDGAHAELLLVVRVAEAGAAPGRLEQLHQLCQRAAALGWKRSRTWWTTIPKRWWMVGSWGMRKTRANLYLSGQIR